MSILHQGLGKNDNREGHLSITDSRQLPGLTNLILRTLNLHALRTALRSSLKITHATINRGIEFRDRPGAVDLAQDSASSERFGKLHLFKRQLPLPR